MGFTGAHGCEAARGFADESCFHAVGDGRGEAFGAVVEVGGAEVEAFGVGGTRVGGGGGGGPSGDGGELVEVAVRLAGAGQAAAGGGLVAVGVEGPAGVRRLVGGVVGVGGARGVAGGGRAGSGGEVAGLVVAVEPRGELGAAAVRLGRRPEGATCPGSGAGRSAMSVCGCRLHPVVIGAGAGRGHRVPVSGSPAQTNCSSSAVTFMPWSYRPTAPPAIHASHAISSSSTSRRGPPWEAIAGLVGGVEIVAQDWRRRGGGHGRRGYRRWCRTGRRAGAGAVPTSVGVVVQGAWVAGEARS